MSTQSFFDTYDPYLKKPHLIGISPDRPILFKDFQQLLSAQARNIEHLILDEKVIVQKPCSRHFGKRNFTSIPNNDQENNFESALYDAQIPKGCAHLKLRHLRVLEIRGGILETILRKILDAFPKLYEVKMTCNEFLHCLVNPGPKAGLHNGRHLQESKTELFENSVASLEIFANTNNDNSENHFVAIRKLCLEVIFVLEMSDLFQNVESVDSVTSLTSVLLDDLKESGSLKELFPNAKFTGKFQRAPVAKS